MLKDVIVIKKGKKMSVHSTLSKAYQAYGWDNYKKDRIKRMPYKKDAYKVQKVPTGVSIVCFELLDWMASKSTVILQDDKTDFNHIILACYDFEVRFTLGAADINGTEELISVLEVQDMNTKKLIKTDAWTNEQIINLINQKRCPK